MLRGYRSRSRCSFATFFAGNSNGGQSRRNDAQREKKLLTTLLLHFGGSDSKVLRRSCESTMSFFWD
jgi:hypothetical protein